MKYAVLTFIFFELFCSPALAQNQNEKKELVIIKNDWSSQIVFSEVLAKILDSVNTPTRFVTFNTLEQWGALTRGTAHVQLEIWEGTMADDLARFIIRDKIEVAKTYQIKTREEWWYPRYVEKICPGLPHWEALKNCSHLFKSTESETRGTYFAGPWEKPDEARVRALGLNFSVIKLASGDQLTKKLLEAVEKQKPILLFNWTPHWVEAEIDGAFVEFPEYSPECETDPKWGINSTFLQDCGNPKNGWLKSVVWKGVKQQWPCAYQLIKNLDLTNKDLADMSHYVDRKHLSYQEAAKKWLDNNHHRWQKWIPKECRP